VSLIFITNVYQITGSEPIARLLRLVLLRAGWLCCVGVPVRSGD